MGLVPTRATGRSPYISCSLFPALCAWYVFSVIEAGNYDCRIAERYYLSNQPSVTVFHSLLGSQTNRTA
jgi:hypothetical protein